MNQNIKALEQTIYSQGIDMNAKLLSKDMMFVDCFGDVAQSDTDEKPYSTFAIHNKQVDY